MCICCGAIFGCKCVKKVPHANGELVGADGDVAVLAERSLDHQELQVALVELAQAAGGLLLLSCHSISVRAASGGNA